MLAGDLASQADGVKANPFRDFKTSAEVIRMAVMMCVWFPLSLRNVEELLHERGIDISHETTRAWWLQRRDRAMQGFRRRQTLEQFASVHSSVFNHFNKDRHLNRRDIFKTNRDAALAEWCQFGAA